MADTPPAGTLAIAAAQCRAARAMLNWSPTELAERAHVTPDWLHEFEQGREPGDDFDPNETARLRQALEGGGIDFLDSGLPSSGGGLGLRLKADGGYVEPENLSSANDG